MSISDQQIARQAKLFVDRGSETIEGASALLKTMRVTIVLSEAAASSSAGQSAFLTAVNTAVRGFAGGVIVSGALDNAVVSPLGSGKVSLEAEAVRLGAVRISKPDTQIEVIIGDAEQTAEISIYAWWKGWIAGRGPEFKGTSTSDTPFENPLAAMAAGAMAISAAFRSAIGDTAVAYQSDQLSLWSLEHDDDIGPMAFRLPNAMWVFGLGNLGQAFVWALSALTFASPSGLTLYLQDFDKVSEENWGTSVLVHEKQYGDLKTWVAEQFLTARGFQLYRVDRALDEHLRRAALEPMVAFCGLDKVPPRRLLGDVGFSHIMDFGLGATHADYSRIRMCCFDEHFTPQQHFGDTDRKAPDLAKMSALKGYQDLHQKKGRCGVEEYAGHSIAYTFVSCVAACVAIAQLARLASGETTVCQLVIDTADIRSKRLKTGNALDRISFGTVALQMTPP